MVKQKVSVEGIPPRYIPAVVVFSLQELQVQWRARVLGGHRRSWGKGARAGVQETAKGSDRGYPLFNCYRLFTQLVY